MELAWAIALVVVVLAGLVLTLVGLPGNWLIVLAAGLYAWQVPPELRVGFGWPVVVALFLLAVLGEILEFIAGAMGASKAGGSRRSALLAIGGSMAGGLVGLVVGLPIPIPVVGSLVGAVLLGAVGAMIGAMLGETWKGRSGEHTWRVGVGAFGGRVFGTVAKLSVGLLMALTTFVALAL